MLVDLLLIGAFSGLFSVPLYALVQHRSDERRRSRIIAANNIMNAGFMVGHCAIRRAVMGERAVGSEASDAELEQMVRLLHASLEQGGLGFSTTISPTSPNRARP